jgi:GNAT superfamily N-acetyltransferase
MNVRTVVPHRMAVHPGYKGLGIAKQLLMHAEEIALSKDISIVRVDTCTRNPATMKLFPSLGYIAIGEIFLKGKPLDHKFMCFEKMLK